VERQGDELYLTHYLTQNGDMFIDSEMVFRVRGEGHIEFKETAVQSLRGGESSRGCPIAPLPKSSPKTLCSRGLLRRLRLNHIISISGPLFMDWLADKGGRGAIDLVMHVQEVEFKEAVEWLSGRDLSQRPANISTHAHSEEREPRWRSLSAGDALEMPEANERRWDAVREYLVENRKLPAVLVDRLHERGLVFADDHQNAVFVRHNLTNNTWVRGDVTGASLRGTWGEDNHYHGLAPGSARDQGWFWIGTGNGPVRQRVLLTESPIDAMSLALLDKERRVQPGSDHLFVYGRLWRLS
jgi:hypothetical protein